MQLRHSCEAGSGPYPCVHRHFFPPLSIFGSLPNACLLARRKSAMASVVHQPPAHVQKGAHVSSMDAYKAMYDRSLKDPEVRDLACLLRTLYRSTAAAWLHLNCGSAPPCHVHYSSSPPKSCVTRVAAALVPAVYHNLSSFTWCMARMASLQRGGTATPLMMLSNCHPPSFSPHLSRPPHFCTNNQFTPHISPPFISTPYQSTPLPPIPHSHPRF